MKPTIKDADRDNALLQEYAQHGNERAFVSLVDRHLPWVYGLISREIYDFRLAEETAQNVFSALAQAAHRQRKIERVSAWLYGTVRKQIALTMRTERRRKAHEKSYQKLTEAERDTAAVETDAWRDHVPQLSAALNRLSVNDQTILFLRFYEGLTFAELSRHLKIKERAAQKRLHRAVDRLRGLLGKRGIPLTAAMLGSSMFTSGGAEPPARVFANTYRLATTQIPTAAVTWMGSQVLMWSIAVSSVAAFATLSGRMPWQDSQPVSNASKEIFSLLGDRKGRKESMRAIAVDDLEAIYRLAERPKEVALAQLIEHLETPQDDVYLQDLFARWSRLDAPRACDAIIKLEAHCAHTAPAYAGQLAATMTIPLNAWLSINDIESKEAMSWVKALPRAHNAEETAFVACLTHLAQQGDPDAAWGWLCQRPLNGNSICEHFLSEVASHFADPHSALHWLGQLDADLGFERIHTSRYALKSSQEADQNRSRLWSAAVRRWFADTPQDVADWVGTLPPSAVATDAAWQTLASMWAHHDPEAAVMWVATLTETQQSEVWPLVIEAWATTDAASCLAWLTGLNDSVLQWTALTQAFPTWLQTHPNTDEMAHWLKGMADEARAQPLFVDFCQFLPTRKALDWALGVPPGVNRQVALEHAFYQLGQEHLEEAIAKLTVIHDTKDRELAVRSLSLGGLTAGKRHDLQAWQETLSPGDEQLRIASLCADLHLLASFSPERAARVIRSHPEGDCRGALIEVLIERTAGRSPRDAKAARSWLAELKDPIRHQRARSFLERVENDFAQYGTTALQLPEASDVRFAEQSLDDLMARLDHVSGRLRGIRRQ